MNVRGEIIVAKNEREVEEWAASKQASKVPFKEHKCLTYYITKDGTLFVCNRIRTRAEYSIYKKRPSPSLVSGHGDMYKMIRDGQECSVFAVRLVFCTFVLGYWSDSVHIVFKDGNCEHIHPDNLAESEVRLNKNRMEQLSAVYKREFNAMVHNVQYFAKIEEQDAKDAVQDAFISLCSKEEDENYFQFFCQRWASMAQKYGMLYWQRVLINEDLCGGGVEVECSMDITWHLNDIQRRVLSMTAEGMSTSSIAEDLGIHRNTVGKILRAAREKMKRYLSTDKYL